MVIWLCGLSQPIATPSPWPLIRLSHQSSTTAERTAWLSYSWLFSCMTFGIADQGMSSYLRDILFRENNGLNMPTCQNPLPPRLPPARVHDHSAVMIRQQWEAWDKWTSYYRLLQQWQCFWWWWWNYTAYVNFSSACRPYGSHSLSLSVSLSLPLSLFLSLSISPFLSLSLLVSFSKNQISLLKLR